MSSLFGDELGRRLHAEHRPVLYARSLRHTDVAIAEVRLDRPTHERSDPLTPDDAFVAALQLRDYPVHEWWEQGRRWPTTSLRAGQTSVYDLTRDPRFTINHPFHSIHVQLPRTLLDAVTEDQGGRQIVTLDYRPGAGVDDPVFRQLALSLRPSFAHPEQASRLFVDGVLMAVAAHVVASYGRAARPAPRRSARLAPAQLRRVLEMIDAHLDGNLTIGRLAQACGLSSNYFVQAFKASTGVPPHRWLLQRRIARAMVLLTSADRPLAEIALECGFANQSHFTRVFLAIVGCPPGQWRRQRGVVRD